MFEIFTETLDQNVTKSHKILFLDGKEDKESKIRNFQIFSENRLNRKAIAFDKISRNCAFNGNSIIIHLLGYFFQIFQHAEFISAMKTVQNPTVFMKTQK